MYLCMYVCMFYIDFWLPTNTSFNRNMRSPLCLYISRWLWYVWLTCCASRPSYTFNSAKICGKWMIRHTLVNTFFCQNICTVCMCMYMYWQGGQPVQPRLLPVQPDLILAHHLPWPKVNGAGGYPRCRVTLIRSLRVNFSKCNLLL